MISRMHQVFSANNTDESIKINGSTILSNEPTPPIKLNQDFPIAKNEPAAQQPVADDNSEATRKAGFVSMGRMFRRHGFERPFGIFQVLSWIIAAFIFISFSVTLYALLLVEGSDYSHRRSCIVCAVMYYLSFLAMVLTTIVVTASNPTDPTIALERQSRLAKKDNMTEFKFNENDYRFHCDICNTHV